MPDAITVEDDATRAALDESQRGTDETKDAAAGDAPRSDDPRVADALRAIGDDTRKDADDSSDGAEKGKDASKGLDDTDEENGARFAGDGGVAAAAGGRSSGGGSPRLTAQQIAAANQGPQVQAQQRQLLMQAQQRQQQMAAQAQARQQMAARQPMMSPQPAAAASGPSYAPGTILVDKAKLAALVDAYQSGGDAPAGGGGGGGSLGSSGGGGSIGSGGGEPPGTVSNAQQIPTDEVRYEKIYDRALSAEETDQVINESLDAAGITDPAARAKWHTVLEFMAQHESGNNPGAVNLTDSNAVGATAPDGAPGQSSRGMWQTIPSTFAAYHQPGTSTNIYNPVASGAAAINYIQDRYGVGADGSGLEDFYANRQSGGYTGY